MTVFYDFMISIANITTLNYLNTYDYGHPMLFSRCKSLFYISNNVHTAKLLVANGNVGKNNGQRFIVAKLRDTFWFPIVFYGINRFVLFV